MKKTFFILILLLILVATPVLAGQNQEQNQEQNQGEATQNQEKNQETNQIQVGVTQVSEEDTDDAEEENDDWVQEQINEGTLGVQNQVQTRAQNTEELKAMIQAKKQELKGLAQQFKEKAKENATKKQNVVREAVHALLASEDLVGGIGKQVSAVAREFNNSIEKTVELETKLQKRGWFKWFFAGGDEEIGQELNNELEQNQNHLQELNQLYKNCNCADDVKNILQEQIQNMENEQNRLQKMADREIKWSGVWGWIKGIFSK